MSAKPQEVNLPARTLVLAGALAALGLSSSPATAGPSKSGPSKGQTSKAPSGKGQSGKGHGGVVDAAVQQAFSNLGNVFAIVKANKKKKNRAKSHDDYWVLINPDPGGPGEGKVLYLCKKKGKKPPTECNHPGARPPEPPGGFTPPCVFCDTSKKDDKWDDYIDKQLAADALHELLQLLKKGQFWGGVKNMFGNMYDFLSALTGPGAILGKAAKWGAGKVLSAATDAAKAKAMEEFLQGLIDALGLDLDPDDLSTEGGLVAAIALADDVAQDAYDEWKAEYDKWKACRDTAFGAGQMPMNSQGEADQCNADAQAAANAAAQAAWDAIFAWEAAMADYQQCLEYNQNLEFETAVWQSTPC